MNWILVIFIILFLLIIFGVVGFLVYSYNKDSTKTNSTPSSVNKGATTNRLPVEYRPLPLNQLPGYTQQNVYTLTYSVREELKKLGNADSFPNYLIDPLQSYLNELLRYANLLQNDDNFKAFVPTFTPTVSTLSPILELIKQRQEFVQEILDAQTKSKTDTENLQEYLIIINRAADEIQNYDAEIKYQLQNKFGK